VRKAWGHAVGHSGVIAVRPPGVAVVREAAFEQGAPITHGAVTRTAERAHFTLTGVRLNS
jgi:hypothetical protein